MKINRIKYDIRICKKVDSGQNEKEILFKPNSKFRVLDIKEEKGRVTITLEEV